MCEYVLMIDKVRTYGATDALYCPTSLNLCFSSYILITVLPTTSYFVTSCMCVCVCVRICLCVQVKDVGHMRKIWSLATAHSYHDFSQIFLEDDLLGFISLKRDMDEQERVRSLLPSHPYSLLPTLPLNLLLSCLQLSSLF